MPQQRDEAVVDRTVALLADKSRMLLACVSTLDEGRCRERAEAALIESAAILNDAAVDCKAPLDSPRVA